MRTRPKTDPGRREWDCRAAPKPANVTSFVFSLYPRLDASQNSSTRISLDEEKTL